MAMDARAKIGLIGDDLSPALFRAAKLDPVRLAADRAIPTPFADGRGLTPHLHWRARAYLEQILALRDEVVGFVLSHVDAVVPQLFAALRELPEIGLDGDRLFFCDLPRLDRPASRAYGLARLKELRQWIAECGFACTDEALADAIREQDIRSTLLPSGDPGEAVLLTGSPDCESWIGEALRAGGVTPIPLEARLPPADPALPPLESLLVQALHWPGGSFAGAERKRAWLDAGIDRHRPVAVVHIVAPQDEEAAWCATPFAQLCGERALPFLSIRIPASGSLDEAASHLTRFARTREAGTGESHSPAPRETARPLPPARTPRPRERSRKSLASVADFGAYQKEWFARIRERAAAGEPLALVNANAPQEILRTLDIPFVVNQWWASIVAAKQQSPRYAGLLRARGYPDDVEAYSAQGLAALFDGDEALAPWGGLPRPTMLHAMPESDPTRMLFDLWAEASGASLHLYERSVESRWTLPMEWWHLLPDDWEAALEPARLDLMTEDLRQAIARLEQETGRIFDEGRFVEIMDLVNEQEDYYRRTRDLIATAPRAPVGVVDTMPATMVPQWHRGTSWARDAARAFFEEVSARVESGQACCPKERLRLMWVGRGMWSDMGFYQRWEESHGAVFVWTMYLGLAADGYIRRFDRGQDPLRALAARFVTMGDELRMPSWAGAWHVKEARFHRVDGAIAIDDADPFVLRALEQSGIPVLKLPMGNYQVEESGDTDRLVRDFLDTLPVPGPLPGSGV